MTDDLLIKYLLNEASESESKAIQDWINLNSANAKHFEHIKLIWETSKELTTTTTVNENDAWERFKTKTTENQHKGTVVRLNWQWLRIAAVLVIMMGTGWLAYQTWLKPNYFPEMVNVQTHQSIKTDTLSDGSVITLNKNSVLTYPQKFAGNKRSITLQQGEAFFNVTKDKKKPFIINVNDITVRVVGTSFNIRSTNNITEVIVETGVVQVIKNKRMVELRPEEKIVIGKNSTTMIKQNNTDHLYNYYRSKVLEANNTPLKRVIEVLNETYNVNIVLEKEELGNLSLTTTFKNESLDNILAVIAQTFNLKVVKEKNRIVIK